ncbi:MAG TPA: DMT family transporter [Candidatus Krumholzibacteria bacterium]|nr:DMT family transporter [Candidatus Krumholzibacteria bacterium]
MNRETRIRADLALVLVTIFWGVTFPLIRSALADVGPHQFIGWRFALGTAAFLPLVVLDPGARAGLRRALLPGALLGLIAWSSYVSQTIGLQTVPAGRAAFITGTAVIIVPLLAPVFRAGRPTAVDFAAAVVAAGGLYLLTGAGATGVSGFGVGDLWVLACALGYSTYVLVLQRVLTVEHHPTSLAFTQVATIGLIGVAVLGVRGNVAIELSGDVVRALGFCALVATVGTFWLQTRFQGSTTPQRASLIFSLEPVFATFFAWWLLSEVLTPLGALGAALILAAVIASETWTGRRTHRSDATAGQGGVTPVDS